MSLGPMQAVFSTLELLRKHENAGFEDEQARKKARWDDEDRALKMEDVARAKKLRSELEDDAKVATVDTVEADGPVRPGEAQPTMASVRGKTYVDPNEAGAAAETYNAPGAVMQRQSRRLLQAGNPQGAATLAETGMKLDSQMSADIDRRFNEDVERNVRDWDTAAQFATKSAFDGGAGQIQYRFAEMPDGTMQPQVSVDGQNWQSDPKGRAYKKDATGFLEAKNDLLRIPTDKKLAHLYARSKAEADAKQQTFTNGLDERKVKVMEKNADTNEQYRRDQVTLAEARARGNGSGGGDDAEPTAGRVDMGVIDKAIDQHLAPKDADGKDLPTDPKLKLFVRSLAAKSPEAYQGDYEGAALAAVDVYQRALKTAGGDLNKAYLLVSAEMDAAKTGLSDYTVAGADGKVIPVGRPVAANGPGRLPAKPATGAMAQLMAEDAAKAKAKQAAEAERKVQTEAAAQAAAQLTIDQIKAMGPDEAFRLLNSPAGRSLDPRVKALLEAQAIGNKIAPARIGAKL